MKPVYKCDYCSFMGTEEEVRDHKPLCHENYDMKSCWTCKNREKMTMEDRLIKYECKAGKDIEAGTIWQHCELYDRKLKDITGSMNAFNPFGGFFGI